MNGNHNIYTHVYVYVYVYVCVYEYEYVYVYVYVYLYIYIYTHHQYILRGYNDSLAVISNFDLLMSRGKKTVEVLQKLWHLELLPGEHSEAWSTCRKMIKDHE